MGQRVCVVHLQQQLPGLDLVADIDIDVLHLPAACAWAEVVHRLDLAVGGEGLDEVLISDLGSADADPLAGERADRINDGKDDEEEGHSPNYIVCCAI